MIEKLELFYSVLQYARSPEGGGEKGGGAQYTRNAYPALA